MKKILSLLLVILFFVYPLSAYAENEGELDKFEFRSNGDVNDDGDVNEADCLLVRNAATGMIDLSEEDFLYADLCRDGEINLLDYLLIKRACLGLIYI